MIDDDANAGILTAMIEGRFTDRQRSLVRDLNALAARRAQGRIDTERRSREGRAEAEQQHKEGIEAVRHRYESDIAGAETVYRQTKKRMEDTFGTEYDHTQLAHDAERERINEQADQNEQEAQRQWDEAVWVTETVFEANENQPQQRFYETREVVEERRTALHEMNEQSLKVLRKCRQRRPPTKTGGQDAPSAEHFSIHQLEQQIEAAERQLRSLVHLRVPRLFRGYILPLEILLVLLGVGVLTVWANGWQANQWLAVAEGGALTILLVVTSVLYGIAKRHVAAAYAPFARTIRHGLTACDHCLEEAQRQRDAQQAKMVAQRDRDLETANQKYEPVIRHIRDRRERQLEQIDEKYPAMLEEIKRRRVEDLEAAAKRHDQRLAEITSRYEEDSKRVKEDRAERLRQCEARYKEEWDRLETEWKEGMTACFGAVEGIHAEARRLFPAWDDPSWDVWTPPQEFSPSIRFGEMLVDRRRIPGGIPEDERLAVRGPESFMLPATLDFPDRCSLLLLTAGEGRGRAVETLQTAMLRLLTSLPPGKVRFTIIDPVGLGQNFAGFMHLSDYEESFVAGRIWTETRHIEQRLTDLTEHMENVIQKYLRNEFETIADYNEHAGEIAEPYRFLVISDFPANFSDLAARRLASIVSSGARCGVYTLITVDGRKQIPQGIDLSDVQRHSATLEFKDGRFVWKDEDFEQLPLTLEEPPPEDFVTHKLHLVGEAAKDATRVEVPFEVIVPSPEQHWSLHCETAVSVPLGRAGATKLQELRIGEGTSQHVLIAGKTGSGKSTLLHVLITNLALWYSPDEVQFYLVDFKKGVEFKTYAKHNLPHARAVAVETDREFGLSVLRRVDAELKHRGDRFRELGVQDLPAYRRRGLEQPMPRTLLIIDEFQEMFVEDDKLAQDAALLLDRLVRQGRAFGIHVLLGSQTLGGAYTLARSTIGQMQVRIALQCAEADSYLIMSDDNSAARLLSRPGEAIYNDAGGAIEGNSPFQIVWLPDTERETRLSHVEQLVEEQRYRRDEPLIVFEGNVAADVTGNHLLDRLLEQPSWPAESSSPQAWLGDPIAIKEPTSSTLRRQSGNNVLLVGQREEAAMAIMSTSMISLAAHRPPGPDGAQFYILDGSPADSPTVGFLEHVAGFLPHEVRHVRWRDVDEAMTALSEELQRRHDADATDAPPVYLLIYGLQRFRMLRMTDDFGFSSLEENKPPSPDRHFADILRDGPPLGMHTITWCDTATNLQRTLDRHGLNEFEQRILFQMSSPDSTQLVDSPAAGNLGLRRALFYNEEEGVLEKFRPYGLPGEGWLETVRQRLGEKAAAGVE